MTKQTTNLNLNKPDMADQIALTISQLGSNFDIIDASITNNTTSLAEITTTNIMDYGVSVDKTGLNPDTTTQAIINASKSGKRVIFPEGTYSINQTIVLSQFTEFVSNGKVTFKIVSDVDVFWITSDNNISDFNIDLSTLNSYTKSIFEISSASRNTLSTYNQGSQYTCKISKINLMFSNNNTVDTTSAIFNIWAKPTDNNGVAYPTFAKTFFNISIDEIYVHGAFAYFMRDWSWNPTYYISASDINAWITGITIKDVSIFGSFLYGIFDAPNETAILDEHYRGCSPMWVTNMRLEYGSRVKRFAYITDGLKVFKDCIPWDFPGASITLLKRTLATYIINNRPYIHMDNGYGSKYYFFDVVDTSGNLVTGTTRDSWIDSMVANYRDGSKPMNEITEALTFKDVPIIIKKAGYKSWQIIRSTNNNFILAPSASVDGVDWDYSKQLTVNGDTGNVSAISFNENGTALASKYMLQTSPSITSSLTMNNNATFISKQTGFKSWVMIRSSNNNYILAPSTLADGTTWDFTKQFTINGDTGNVSVISLNENGTPLSSKYAPIMVSPPATATSTGTTGQMAQDGSYLYVCTGTNTWKRTALATW